MIRLLALVLLAVAVWRLLVRRTESSPVVTVTHADGTMQRFEADDGVAGRMVAIAARVAP